MFNPIDFFDSYLNEFNIHPSIAYSLKFTYIIQYREIEKTNKENVNGKMSSNRSFITEFKASCPEQIAIRAINLVNKNNKLLDNLFFIDNTPKTDYLARKHSL